MATKKDSINDIITDIENKLQSIPEFNNDREDVVDWRADKELQKGALDTLNYVFDINTGGLYKYKNKRLLKRDHKDKFTIDVTPGTIAGLEELHKGKHLCKSLLATDEEDCMFKIDQCLLADDNKSLIECVKKIKDVDKIDDFIKQEINDVHPLIAFRILQKFGFRKHKQSITQRKEPIYVVESISHWLATYVSNKFTEEEQKLISNNKVLLKYLGGLIELININPGLINKDYDGIYFNKEPEYLPKFPVPTKEPIEKQLKELRNHLEREKIIVNAMPLAKKIIDSLGGVEQYVVPPFFIDYIPKLYQSTNNNGIMEGIMSTIVKNINQIGGNNYEWITQNMEPAKFTPKYVRELGEAQLEGKAYPINTIFQTLFSNFISELREIGVIPYKMDSDNIIITTIDKDGNEKPVNAEYPLFIKTKIDELKDTELELMEILRALFKYVKLYKKYRNIADDNVKEILNEDKVNFFIEKTIEYEKEFMDKQINLIDFLQKIIKLKGNESSNKSLLFSESNKTNIINQQLHQLFTTKVENPLTNMLHMINPIVPPFMIGGTNNKFESIDNKQLSNLFLNIDQSNLKYAEKIEIIDEIHKRMNKFNQYYIENKKYDIWM